MDLNYLFDTNIVGINKCTPHSDHKFYFDKNESVKEISLNGEWKFKYLKNIDDVTFDFTHESFDVSEWDNIKVPAHIELCGYEKPKYVNTMYPWDGIEDLLPPQIPTKLNRFGLYSKEVIVADDFMESSTYIRFEGVESCIYLYVNGEFIGYSEDSFTPAEFDISKNLKVGSNKICALVAKFCTGSWLEDQDFWRFFGIFRDVKIYSVPKIHIYDMKIVSLLDSSYTNGILDIDFEVHSENYRLNVEFNNVCTVLEKNHFHYEISDVNAWSAENPYLYDLEVSVTDSEGNVVEIVKEKIGFRTFELKDKLMLINGKPITFNGVNRHEFSAVNGRAITYEETLQDIIIMKQNNINALRTSHYPNNSYLYRLCDEYGIYLIDETNLETHGTWQFMGKVMRDSEHIVPHNKDEWKKAVLQRGQNMYERDKNHTSIIIWSCGNESFGGSVIYELSEYFRQTDKNRLVHYEGIFHDRSYNDTSDMESQMYTYPEDVIKYLENDPQKPLILCEYSHSMGNSNGGLYKYIDIEEKYPMYQGGFIWDFIDQSIIDKNSCGEDYFTSGGDFYDRPNDGNFCGNGIVFADRTITPKMLEVKYLYAPVKIEFEDRFIKVTNKNLFVNTDIYKFIVKKFIDGEMVNRRECELDLKPQEEGYLPFEIVDTHDDFSEYNYIVMCVIKEDCSWCNKGHEIFKAQKIVNSYKVNKIIEQNPKIIKGNATIGIEVEGTRYLINGNNGELYSIYKNEKEYLKEPIQLNFWKAPIDNDRANGLLREWAKWKVAGLYYKKREIEVIDNKIIIKYGLPIGNDFCFVTYTFNKDGSINMTYRLETEESQTLPNFGFVFKMNKDFENLEWYGNCSIDGSCDRPKSAIIKLSQNKVMDNYINYLKPQDSGNKTDVRFIKIFDSNNNKIKLSSDVPFETSVLPFTAHELENAKNSKELPPYNNTVVSVNMFKTGVGGNNSWGSRPSEEHILKCSNVLEFTITLEVE